MPKIFTGAPRHNGRRAQPTAIFATSVLLALGACGGGQAPDNKLEPTAIDPGRAFALVAPGEPAVTSSTVPAGATGSAGALSVVTDGNVTLITGPVAATVPPASTAAGDTYVIDSSTGNDSNSGLADGAGSHAGPWRTLSRLARATLRPGDTVHLNCGSVWAESLWVPASGTVTQPISVRANPAGCINPPLIDGATVVQPQSWVKHNGNVYRAPLAVSLPVSAEQVPTGSFERGNLGWRIWSPVADATMKVVAGCPAGQCLSTSSATSMALVSSPSFALSAGQQYALAYSALVPAGKQMSVVLRRAVSPFDTLGYTRQVTGTGAWQTITANAVATISVSAARLDFLVETAATTAMVDNVRVTAPARSPVPALVRQLTVAGGHMEIAHHPNRGFDATQPDSPYLAIAADSDRVTIGRRPHSTYITTGADLVLPTGAAITPGTDIRIRANAWTLVETTVSAVQGSRLTLAQPSYPALSAGWGYYLTGQLWMLDSPGEWFQDRLQGFVYARMPDSLAPSKPILAGYQPVGIDLGGASYVEVTGVTVKNFAVGVGMRGARGVAVRNSSILDSFENGIDVAASNSCVLEGNLIERSAVDAIYGGGYSVQVPNGLRVVNNVIRSSGVEMQGGNTLTLPRQAFSAIGAGVNATVTGNQIFDAAYAGILFSVNGTVTGNFVTDACAVLDDCGGIYTLGLNNRSRIANNVVTAMRGALAGKPVAARFTQAQGIYVDNQGSGVVVQDNVVIDADNGVQIHNAGSNRIERNKLIGNRSSQLWMQETARVDPLGDLRNNVSFSNQLVPLNTVSVPVTQWSALGSTEQFGSFDANVYFDRLTPRIAVERSPTATHEYTLPRWKAAQTSTGTPRNLDPTGRGMNAVPFAVYLNIGPNVVANGNLRAGLTGWTSWNQSAPRGQTTLQTCGAVPCARYVAGGSAGLLSSPNFALVKNQFYRLSFDAAGSVDGQRMAVTLRRGGGGSNGYEPLGYFALSLPTSRAMTRYSVVFQATATVNVNDPVTRDLGARLDFEKIQPGLSLTIANVEVVPASSSEGVGPVHTFANATGASQQMMCPASNDPKWCGQYLRLTDNAPVVWPLLVPAMGAEVIFAVNRNLYDTDADGVADSQDTCPATPVGATVNASGCAFGQ